MGVLDSDSESDCSESSCSSVEVYTGGSANKRDVSKFINKSKASLNDYDAFKGVDDEADETAARMKEMLLLRESLGMDKDVNFLASQAAREEEKEKLRKMCREDRMKHEADDAGDMMAKIKAKQVALSKKKAEEDAKRAEEDAANAAEEEEKRRKKKEKKEKKKKKTQKS